MEHEDGRWKIGDRKYEYGYEAISFDFVAFELEDGGCQGLLWRRKKQETI
jgi:hypothetical protein